MTRGAVPCLLLLLGQPAMALADEICLAAPYEADAAAGSDVHDLAALFARLEAVMAAEGAMARLIATDGPSLCSSDELVEEQAYYEPATNRIVIRWDLPDSFKLAILLHELRHLQQSHAGLFPSIEMSMVAYRDAQLALEADAAAVSLHIAWHIRETGDDGPWQALAGWPTHDDLAEVYRREITATGDPARAAAATFAQWHADPDRRRVYAHASYATYLNALDRRNMLTGTDGIAPGFAERLCRLPDDRPYACAVPGP